MDRELFDALCASKMKTNDIYRIAEQQHFAKSEITDEWLALLDKYVRSKGGFYSQALADALNEFVSMKNNIPAECGVDECVKQDVLRDIISFCKTPMCYNVFRKYPDASGYYLLNAENNGTVKYTVMYKDADSSFSYYIGDLFIAVDFLKKEAHECKTRGNYGTRFWWVNKSNIVRYYLFTLHCHKNDMATEYYEKYLSELNNHYCDKENVSRSYEYVRGNSKVFS